MLVASLNKKPSRARVSTIFSATSFATSIEKTNPYFLLLINNIAVLNSKSGGAISTERPPSNRDASLASIFLISEGGLSEEKTIWRCLSRRVLKV